MSEEVKRPLHENCTLNCDIKWKMWGNRKAKFCETCFEIFEYEDFSDAEIKLDERKKEREEKVDKNIVEASREKKSERYKSDINIKELYEVKKIESNQTHDWLLHKHYARRIPLITYAFGLFDVKKKVLVGVVTYAPPARSLNDGYGCFGEENPVQTYELNRLCVNDDLPSNTLSFFVGQSLDLLKQLHVEKEKNQNDKLIEKQKPVCVVSYADANNNHHGYIYQATNWIYTGETQPVKVFYDSKKKKNVHARTLVATYGSSSPEALPDHIGWEYEKGGKFRYFKFLGTKSQVKKMKKILKYKVQDYPKGLNEKYDSSHKVVEQGRLF